MLAHIRSTQPSLEPELSLLRRGYRLVAGVDEVGRGSWAGPVVAAAVILPVQSPRHLRSLAGLRDSKQLSARQRERLLVAILDTCIATGIGWCSHHVIDRSGIGPANRRAMQRAVRFLRTPPDALLLDYFTLPDCPLPQTALVDGDARSFSIAAASVVAKVIRDRWMERWDARYPSYGFARHKGYGTRAHREALRLHGPSPIHRRSFRPVSAGI